jgi:hypothetical protein
MGQGYPKLQLEEGHTRTLLLEASLGRSWGSVTFTESLTGPLHTVPLGPL